MKLHFKTMEIEIKGVLLKEPILATMSSRPNGDFVIELKNGRRVTCTGITQGIVDLVNQAIALERGE